MEDFESEILESDVDIPIQKENNESPLILNIVNNFIWLIESYGWYILIIGVIYIYLYVTYLQEKIKKFFEKKAEREYAAKYHKNPELFQERMIGVQTARELMQEKYNRQAEEHMKNEELRQERKRQEWLEKHDNIGGHSLGSNNSKQKASLKNEYNPLMGDNSRGYRPERKSACGKGGCGK